MEDGLLSLKWNNHKTTFFDILRVLREKSTYTDATLAVEGKFYQVHKLVMSTCSEYFSEIFERTPCKSPVIVLKDVRSQDLEALLDYMYLGEVNVNQNDLALLLKTAECLRIKGLAVPDEDPASKHRKGPDERLRESPPPKRRRHTVPQSAPVSDDANRAPSPANSKSSNTSSSNAPSNAATQPSQHTVSLDHNQQDIASEPPPPMVKVEMEEAEDNDDSYMHENNYDGSGGGGGGSEGDGHRDFPDIEKAEHDIAGYGSNTYPAGPSVQGGELPWDEGDSSSFPPESFSGDVPGSQTQGDDDEEGNLIIQPLDKSPDKDFEGSQDLTVDAVRAEDLKNDTSPGGSQSSIPPLLAPNPLSLSPFQARQCQLCLVTLANANLLRRHVEDHHFHIRKYNCIHCGKKFKRKEHKERHERIHTGEKPFACHICLARFTQKEHLKGHLENIHFKPDKEKGGDIDKDDKEGELQICEDDLVEASDNTLTSETKPEEQEEKEKKKTSTSPPTSSSTSPLAAFLSNSSSSAVASPSSSSTTVAPTLIPAALANDLSMNQFTALYAPVTRKTVSSPNKHMQTITINFN